MLKKCICIIALLILIVPVWVNAETIKDGDTTYLLEEVEIESELFDEHTYFQTITEDGDYIYTKNGVSYKVKPDGSYTALSMQEEMDLFGDWTHYEEYIDGNSIYYKEYAYHQEGYLKTEDTALDSTKTYYKYNNEISWYEEVRTEDLDVAEIANYYEMKYLKRNNSATEVVGQKYYTTGNYPEIVEVITFIPEEADMYVVELTTEELYTETKIATLDAEKFAKPLADYDFMMTDYTEGGEVNYVVFTDDNGMPIVYTADGELLEDVFQITTVSDKLRIVMTAEDYMEFWNKGNNVIHHFEEQWFYLYPVMNKDNVIYLYSPSHDEHYTLTEYSVESGNNQTYDGKDLKITLTDKDIKAITINGKELKSDNYTISEGVITLKKSYLGLLAKGTYDVEVEYENGVKVPAKFNIKAANRELDNTPATGNIENVLTIMALAMVILSSGVATVLCYKKK